MKFSLFGTRFYVSFLFAVTLALMIAFDRTGLILPTLFAVLLHEIGHLFVMWLTDCTPVAVRLIPASVQIVRKMSPRYRDEVLIALAGPVVNLFLFGLLFVNYLAFKNNDILRLAILNLVIGTFNLLPVWGLDGGTVLCAILSKRWDISRAQGTVRIITAVLAALALGIGTFMWLRGGFNPSIFIVALYLLICSIIKM